MGKASRERKEKHELRELAGYRPLFFDVIAESMRINSEYDIPYILETGKSSLAMFGRRHNDEKPIHWNIPIIDATGFLDTFQRALDQNSICMPPFQRLVIESKGVLFQRADGSYTEHTIGFLITVAKQHHYLHGDVVQLLIESYTIDNQRIAVWEVGSPILDSDGHFLKYGDTIESVMPKSDRIQQVFILNFLEFLNMRNVELIDGPPPPPRIQALHQKHYGEPLYTYKVLSVGHPRKEYTEDGDYEHGTHATPRGHIVRGHPRRVEGHPFIPDGVYWIPAHTRGDFTKGEVFKDYRIVTPDEDQD